MNAKNEIPAWLKRGYYITEMETDKHTIDRMFVRRIILHGEIVNWEHMIAAFLYQVFKGLIAIYIIIIYNVYIHIVEGQMIRHNGLFGGK